MRRNPSEKLQEGVTYAIQYMERPTELRYQLSQTAYRRRFLFHTNK